MRIKKVSQTTPIQAQVVDGYSTSEIDSYSANYVNNTFQTKGKILWTNSNPNTSFNGQNITLSSDDYDVLEIYYYDWVDNYKDLLCQKTIKGYHTLLQMHFAYDNKVYAGNRRILYVNDTTLNIQSNIRNIDNSSFNTTTINNWNVPVFIIGYKTGLFE